MATSKSDFAQKLLSDLRLRKEKMAATQNSNRQSGQMSSREKHGNPAARTCKSAQQTNSTQPNRNSSSSSNRGSRATSFSEPSNQLVLYETGQNSGQVKDLTTAIAFAFENTGKFTRIEASGSNPLVNFFKRFGRRSMDFRKTNTSSFDNHNNQLPSISQVQITEISKGAQKINQIVRVCSNSINFDRNSFEVGRELMKGSIDLEESLRLLVNLQEASAYNNGAQQKNRIKFLDKDEDDDEEENNKTAENWQLSRPRFSFDNNKSRNSYIVQDQTRPNSSKGQQIVSNAKTVSHRRSISYDQDCKMKQNNNSSSSQEKGRVSNVIAKLMGLEDLPQKNEKDMKVSQRTDKLAEPLNRERQNGSTIDKNSCQSNGDTKLHHRPEKIRETMNECSKMVLEGNKPRKDSNVKAVGTDAASATYHAIVHHQGNEHRILQNHERELNLKANGEKKLPQKTQNRKPLTVEDLAQNKSERNVSVEKRTANKHLPSNQNALLRVQAHKKRHTEQMDHKLEKPKFSKQKREDDQVEPVISSKSKKISAANVQKKMLLDISVSSNGKPRKFIENVPKRESPNSRNRDDAMMIDTTEVTAVNEEDLTKEDKRQNLSPRKPQFGERDERQEKPVPVSVTQKRAISQKVDKSENISKIDVLMTRKNASMNQLSRSVKQSTNMLQDLERHIRNKSRSSKRKEQQSDSKSKDGEVAVIVSNASEKSTETVNQPENLQNEAEQVIKVESTDEDEIKTKNTPTSPTPNQNEENPAEDECKTENKLTSPTPNENYNDQKDPGEVSDYLQKVDESCMSRYEQELRLCDQSSEKHEEDIELYNPPENEYKKLPAKGRQQEHLTEPEKDLKEIVLKSQLFLNTAEALFKLNIPVSFLHATDHNYESTGNKLVLDCGYEIMKRKARRHEVTLHPYMKTTISCAKESSLDELVKQLCKDIEVLKSYGGNESDVAEHLHEMLNKDIYDKDPDANSMWDFEWNKMMSILPEKDDVIRDVEKHMLNGLVDEITNDLLLVNVSA